MFSDAGEVWVKRRAGRGRAPGSRGRKRHFTVAELEDVTTVKRTELGLGFEGHVPLATGWPGAQRVGGELF